MSISNPGHWVRPSVRSLHAYVPGEQPKVRKLVKLNTNENPYPPSPKVLSAVTKAVDGRLRLYPNPVCQPLREKLAALHGCTPDHLLIGNGSDEVLALLIRAFVEPQASLPPGAKPSASRVQYFWPSYSLYPVLTDIHGAVRHPIPLPADFSIPNAAALRRLGWDTRAAITLVTTPNAPSGRGYSTTELEALCQRQRGIIVLDEAYVDFAEENALELALRYPHVLVSRTFSKAYSLCFQRVGYAVGHPELIGALAKLKDSYNVNGLGQVAAEATLGDLPYYRKNFRRVCATRQRVDAALTSIGFRVLPSQANFLLVEPPGHPAEEWHVRLRNRGFLVRWFSGPEVRHYLRISIGTDAEMDALLAAVKKEL
jgi:histidinol-phosphate aminotransferase